MSFHLWALEKHTKVIPKIRTERDEDLTKGKTTVFSHLFIKGVRQVSI